MSTLEKVSCSMDCFDLCGFNVTIENNRILKLEGDKSHPVTKGFICKKGRDLIKRHYHSDRIQHPLLKKNGKFVKISWDEVFDIVSERLLTIKEKFGSQAVLNYSGGGYCGLKGSIDTIFFNCFGGVTKGMGSLCLGAGIAAQKYDFGSSKSHFSDDILNSDYIIVWGKNPAYTSLHLYSLLVDSFKKGARIVVIDPIKTATAKKFGNHIKIKPNTDSALALCMANIIICNDLHDKVFIKQYVSGFEQFKRHIEKFTPEWAQQETGLSAETIEKLAIDYAKSPTASIQLGYGIQRYGNGGNTVRCIDALGAVTGNLGKKGCGVHYASISISPFLNRFLKESETYAGNKRFFIKGCFGDYLTKADNPKIKAVFVSKANPLNQSPDLNTCIKGYKTVDFKVVFEHFMTDTARYSDLVLPAATVFEQDDIFVTSMYSHVLNYSSKVVEPEGKVMSEFDFYIRLAKKMGMDNLGFKSSDEFLHKSCDKFLNHLGIDFNDLKNQYIRLENDEISWADKQFSTLSGKYELYSESALKDNLSALPEYIPALSSDEKYPLRLLTCHAKESMHSQGFTFSDQMPVVYLNNETAALYNLNDRDQVIVKSNKGEIKAVIQIDNGVYDRTVFIYQGYWHKSGSVNFLTDSSVSDMGMQAAYYDSFCRLSRL